MPVRTQLLLASTPGEFSLWNYKTFVARSGVLVQHPDGTWTEYVDTVPNTVQPRNKYFINSIGSSTAPYTGYETPLRYYDGSRTYVVDDTQKAELVAAITTNEPAGYSAYLTAAPSTARYTGDEIIHTGYDDVHGPQIQNGGSPWGQDSWGNGNWGSI